MIKKISKVAILPIMMIAVLILSAVSVSAGSSGAYIDGNYKTVASATATEPLTRRNITISCVNVSEHHHNDIRFLNKNGNVISEIHGAIGTNAQRTMLCPDGTYYVQIRIGSKNIQGNFVRKEGSCHLTW